jgi:hypothetical protein
MGILTLFGYPLFLGLNLVARRRSVPPVVVGICFGAWTSLAMVLVIFVKGAAFGPIVVGIPLCAMTGFAAGYLMARAGTAFRRTTRS